MITSLERFFSQRARHKGRTEIRELLKWTREPDMISFGGGLPPPGAFPGESVREICLDILARRGTSALQYGTAEGEQTLREGLAAWISSTHGEVRADDVLITAGSQQGLDLVGKVFLDPGDCAIVELPTYIGGLQAFYACRARLIGVPQDGEGMRIDLLAQQLKKLKRRGRKPKFIYVVPDFQNPSGATLSASRRYALLKVAYEYRVPVIEDTPYRDLRYAGIDPPSLFRLDTEGLVIQLSTFSKILSPGIRLGWMVAPPAVREQMIIAKQGMDVATAIFPQLLAAECLKRGLLDANIAAIRAIYGAKLQVMVSALTRHMPEGVAWTEPEGGLFLWLQLPQGVDANEVFFFSLKRRVTFVTGSPFFCNGTGQNTMRLNFSYPSHEQIEEGVCRLAEVIRRTSERYRSVTTVSRESLFTLPSWVADLTGTPFNPACPLPV